MYSLLTKDYLQYLDLINNKTKNKQLSTLELVHLLSLNVGKSNSYLGLLST